MFCFISCFALLPKNADVVDYESPEKAAAFALVQIYTVKYTLSYADLKSL